MQIEVQPITGTEQFTVMLAGQYRLLFSGTREAALEVVQNLRKQINRSGPKAPKKALDTEGVIV